MSVVCIGSVRGTAVPWRLLLVLTFSGPGCAGRFGAAPRPAPPMVSGPEVVRWVPGRARTLPLTLDNSGGRPMDVPEPSRRVFVEVRPTTQGGPSCRLRPMGPGGPTVHIGAGARVPVAVELGAACAALGPGEYRYDARLDLPPVLDGPRSRADPLATASGILVVERPGPAAVPAAPEAVAPPADPLRREPASPPPAPDPQVSPGVPGFAADATAACVDRELARRSLNAFGDPPGTVYSEVPPAGRTDRVERVLARHPEIRTTCAVPRVSP